MPRRLISRSELARIAGVSPAAVTQQCRPGKALAEGTVRDRVDLDAPCVLAWLKGKGRTSASLRTEGRRARPKRAKARSRGRTTAGRSGQNKPPSSARGRRRRDEVEPVLLDDLGEYEGLTLRQLRERHGTERAFKDLLEARAKIAAIQERELLIATKRLEFVPRELVKQFVFGAIDAALRRILTDAKTTLVRRIHSAGKAGEPIEDSDRLFGEVMSSHLELAKQQAARALDNA